MPDGMKLYYAPKTRSQRPRWLLEELGVAYEKIGVDLKAKAHKTPEYLRIHPLGLVPALQDGNLTLIESGAMVAYLADKYPEKRLAPPLGTPERGLYYQWLFYATATMEPPVMQVFYHTQLLPEDKRIPAVVEPAKQKFRESLPLVEKTVEKGPWILGSDFSAADVLVGINVIFGRALKLIDGFPALEAYAKRLTDRPAWQRARAD